ncbi:MAG: hypothetical protein ACE5I1_07615 [bacterium]
MAYLELSPFDTEDPPTDTAGKMAHMVAEYCLKAYLMLNKKKLERATIWYKYWMNALRFTRIKILKKYVRTVRY